MSIAKLAGEMVTRAVVVLPRNGIWTALVHVASVEPLSGLVTLELADASYIGTIVDGGPFAGDGWYRLVGGAAGWRNTIDALSYRSEAGVKLSTVVNDAANDVGETMAPFDEERIGPAFVRPKASAARVLDLLSENDWYVDESGITHIGIRDTSETVATYTLIEKRTDRRTLLLAADAIKTFVPGLLLEGFESATVRHELGPDGLRTFIVATSGESPIDRMLQAIRTIVRTIMRDTWYHGLYEYTVQATASGYLDLTPVTDGLGLPPISNVPMRVGISGGRADPAIGSSVLVGFVNGDPCRPFCTDYVGEVGAGAQPQHVGIYGNDLNFGAANGPKCARVTDAVNCGYLTYSNPTTIDRYFIGTSAGKTAADNRVTALGGPPAFRFDLNDGTGTPDTAGGGQITSGSSKVKVAS